MNVLILFYTMSSNDILQNPMKSMLMFLISIMVFVNSDPQVNLLNKGCSQFASADLPGFSSNRNKTLNDLRGQLVKNNTHFATAQQSGIYGMVQCRNYLSNADCVACFDAAVALTLNCSTDGGARVIFEGCFLRYEAHDFYSVATLPGNTFVCSKNQSLIESSVFNPVVDELLKELEVGTPKMTGFFAAATRQVIGASSGATVYAVAQCAQTLSQSVCRNCLNVAYNSIRSCPPLSGGSSVDAGCFLRYSDRSFFPDDAITNITPYVQERNSSTKIIVIGGLVGTLCLLLLIVSLILWHRLLRKSTGRGDILGVTNLQGPINYNHKDLKSATKSFSEEYKVGEGGFGDVYKGVIKNGDVVAVKKLAITSSKAKADFESEVRLIGNVHHRNIIRLLGCSAKGSELLLVFEYMENGSLDKFLYGPKQGTLTWKQRIDIINGIARGLAYLHEQFHLCIIHRDIKSSNILLDDDFQPKIADFGLARLVRDNQTHISTRFAGTLGYTAPEYAIHGKLSEKVDTYGFGIVVLEIISGRRCTDLNNEPVSGSLLEYAWKLYEGDMDLDLVDETLGCDEYDIYNVKRIIEIALMCTQSPTSLRPTMSEVVALLTSSHSFKQRPLTLSKQTLA